MSYEIARIIIAWITAIGIMLLSIIYPMRIYVQKYRLRPEHPISKANKFLRKIHKPLGVVIIPFTFLHCRFSSQKMGFNMGTFLLVLLALLLLNYSCRKLLRSKWIKLHRGLTVLLWSLLIAHILIDTKRINSFIAGLF
ncbi:MAG: hypothetical protein PHX08_17605 [Lachnospiraceae bacterium]|nr:hypothetical protein [Lachnospiraceae bacterium]